MVEVETLLIRSSKEILLTTGAHETGTNQEKTTHYKQDQTETNGELREVMI